MRSAFRPLRHAFVFRTITGAIAETNRNRSEQFRVVHFSVQADHLHLLVEASDKATLSSGMRGLTIRIARSVNRLVGRAGKVWADRWHGRELGSPREVRLAVAYVLANFRKHHPKACAAVDPFSSAPYFTDFRELDGRAPIDVNPGPIRRELGQALERWVFDARTWLLRVGWRKGGGMSLFDTPHVE
jgi:REP element-mobilizing transposase RayT